MKKILKVSLSILVMLIILVFGKMIGNEIGNTMSKTNRKEVLIQSVKDINKQAPMMLDTETKFIGAIMLTDDNLMYNYILINYPSNSLNPSNLKHIEKNLIKSVCENKRSRYLLKQNITLTYKYLGNDNLEITRIPITELMCH